ncbi:MAG TPA: chromate transporter, partial [Methylophaga sp.]|nr:chromate transporter [Methylophaga sp.]
MSGLHKRYTDVFKTFLTLGLTSFGGPVAHIAYFRKCFVEEKNWLTDTQFSQLLALCHLLPGPSSSQLGFAIGLLRANGIGALLAFIAFTLPSALFLIIFAYSLDTFSADISKKLVHGLSLIAVPVVLDAVIKMARQLTPDWQRLTIAVLSLSAILFINSTYVIFFVIIIGAIGGLFLSTG